MKNPSIPTSKRTASKASTEAKAKAKAEASIAATAAALMAEPTEAERIHAMLTPVSGQAVSQHLANINTAVSYLADTEANAFAAKVMARQAIGAQLFAAYTEAMRQTDAEATVPEAVTVTFTTLAGVVFPAGKRTKAEYEALAAAKRPVARSWSALAEDYALFVHTAGDAWRAAYDASRGEAEPIVRDYLSFSRQANAAEAKANTAEGETPQAKGARTKAVSAAAAKREAERQAEAKAKATADREAKADTDAKAKVAADLARVNRVLGNPAASAVEGFPAVSGGELADASVKVLAELAATCLALVAHRETEASKAKAEADAAAKATPKVADTVAAGQAKASEALASHDTEADALALGTEAEANAADDLAEYEAFKAFKAMKAAANA